MEAILNRKARYEYQILEEYICGMVLMGSEVKSLRMGKASIAEAYALINRDEVYIRGMHIDEYKQGGTHNNHDPYRERKLLLNKSEIQKLQKKLQDKGLTLIPLKLFFSKEGRAKLVIGLAKGKKLHDKRDSIKGRDTQREMERALRK